ncbi:MAG: hypothetical protein Q9M39_07990 [Sulfurovum sp.]|nr:hypothetical protein [Sulfurovum sp.]
MRYILIQSKNPKIKSSTIPINHRELGENESKELDLLLKKEVLKKESELFLNHSILENDNFQTRNLDFLVLLSIS